MTSANKNNLLYTSREFDFETGLQFNRMRYYNPNLGRFNLYKSHFLKNNYIFSKNVPTYTFSSSGGGDDTQGCINDCFNEREDWEIECLDDYWNCINNCYEFNEPSTVIEGIRVGELKGKAKFPEDITIKDPKEDECDCLNDYLNCMYYDIPTKLGNCIEECYKK